MRYTKDELEFLIRVNDIAAANNALSFYIDALKDKAMKRGDEPEPGSMIVCHHPITIDEPWFPVKACWFVGGMILGSLAVILSHLIKV